MARDVFTGKEKFGYEGFSEDFTIPMIASSLLRAEKELGVDGKFRFAGEELNRSLSQEWMPENKIRESLEIIHNIQSDEIVSLSSGYDWHGTHVIFFKGHLLYCNKGAFGKGGINVYKIPDPKKVTKQHLINLIQRQKFSNMNFLSEEKLISELKLQHVIKIRLKDQRVGNCTYVNTRAGARALMAIHSILMFQKPLSYAVWRDAFDDTREDYKKFFQLDRDMLLEDLLGDVRKHEDNFSPILTKDTLFGDLLRRIKPGRCKKEHVEMLKKY